MRETTQPRPSLEPAVSVATGPRDPVPGGASEPSTLAAVPFSSAPASGRGRPGTRRKVGRPRLGEESKTLSRTKPWEAELMSERTWYRRQKEKRDGKSA